MAKKNGNGNAAKLPSYYAKKGEIGTAAASSMEPRDYSEGYPHQRGVIYQGRFSVGKGKPGGRG